MDTTCLVFFTRSRSHRLGALLPLKGNLSDLSVVGLASLMFGLGLRNIPVNPPHKGLVTM